MWIGNNVLKHYLRNVYFINGTAYAGKSTMVKMIADRYDMVHCGENYHSDVVERIASKEEYPNLSYFKTMKDWQEFLNRTPEQYESWIRGCNEELVEFEIAELINLSRNRKVIVDTNIPVSVLKEIASYNQIALMLSPLAMAVDRFFDREDEDKKFLLAQISNAENPAKTMDNFRNCIARINSKENYDDFLKSGLFTIIREDGLADTKEIVLEKLAVHFKL